MNLLKMSFAGAVMILAVIVIRAIGINRLPKKTFVALWGIVLLRLLIPFSIPSALSIYSLIPERITDMPERSPNLLPAITPEQPGDIFMAERLSVNGTSAVSLGFLVWCVGVILCALFFILFYLHCQFRFRTSLPVRNAFAKQWLRTHPAGRPISIRQSDTIASPLTYGIFHPVILMPKKTDWENTKRLEYVFLHEYMHIRHFDSVKKPLAILALCIHWFNPLVWMLYFLFNRDLELACDESVVQSMGVDFKSDYARMLIDMEAGKSGLTPLYNHFNKSAIKERITAIMKTRTLTAGAILVSIVILVAATVLFATSAVRPDSSDQNNLTELPGTVGLDRDYEESKRLAQAQAAMMEKEQSALRQTLEEEQDILRQALEDLNAQIQALQDEQNTHSQFIQSTIDQKTAQKQELENALLNQTLEEEQNTLRQTLEDLDAQIQILQNEQNTRRQEMQSIISKKAAERQELESKLIMQTLEEKQRTKSQIMEKTKEVLESKSYTGNN